MLIAKNTQLWSSTPHQEHSSSLTGTTPRGHRNQEVLEAHHMDEEEQTGSGVRCWRTLAWTRRSEQGAVHAEYGGRGRQGEATDGLSLFGTVQCYSDFLYRLLIYILENYTMYLKELELRPVQRSTKKTYATN